MNEIILNIEDEQWKKQDGFVEWSEKINIIFEKVLKRVYFGSKSFEINLLLSNDENIKMLNKRFLNKDTTTNVLSFPQFCLNDICKIDTVFQENRLLLGDIIMSYNKIMQESKEFSFKFFDRATHLLIHSILHLFGFDHIKSEERERMEELEIKILQNFGLENPYIIKE